MYYQFNLSKGVPVPIAAQLRGPAGALVRIVDDAIAEHDAVRDDLAMAAQVGWFPPRPRYVARMLRPAAGIGIRPHRRRSAANRDS
jgi:hypothetical protein